MHITSGILSSAMECIKNFQPKLVAALSLPAASRAFTWKLCAPWASPA